MITEDDLRATLAAHTGGAPANAGRVAQVRELVARRHRRRRRVVAGGLLTVAVVATGVVVPLSNRGDHPERVKVAATQATPYPEYAVGGRALGGARLVTADDRRSVSYTFTPTSYLLEINTTCDRDGGTDNFTATLTVNGHRQVESVGTCSTFGSGDLSDAAAARTQWQKVVRLGQPNVVTLTVQDGSDRVPAGIALVSAVYQGVPYDEYPLPPRPARVDRPVPITAGRTVADPAAVGDDATTRFTVTVSRTLLLDLLATGPGLLDVSAGGHHLETAGTYDWTGFDFGVDLSPTALARYGIHVREGQQLTVTVTASHFTGPFWLVTATRY